MPRASIKELQAEIKNLKEKIEEQEREISELQIESTQFEHRLAGLSMPEDFYPRLSDALLSSARDIGRTVLGPLNTVELVTEALEHGYITLAHV